MPEITIGDAKLRSSNGILTIEHVNGKDEDQDSAFSFDADAVQELVRFLTAQSQSALNRREAFRVPVFDSSGLEVQLGHNQTRIQGRVTSISMTGVFVAVSLEDRGLPVDTELEITLRFEGEQHSHAGIIRRIADGGYGIRFLDAGQNEQIDPPADIARIVMALQRQWAARQA